MSDAATLRSIAGPCTSSQSVALEPLIERIGSRFGRALVGIIYYGSCLRSGNPYDGLVDFYVVVDSYRHAHASTIAAAANKLVPPNVYYLEAPASKTGGESNRLRCKYAVITESDLTHGVRSGFLSGLWGRFAQPVAIVASRNTAARDRLRACCGQAVITLLDRTLPALQSPASAAEAYEQALALSYGSELRTERQDRSTTLVDHDGAEYARRLHAAIPSLAFPVTMAKDGCLTWAPSARQHQRAVRRWQLMQPAGHAVSVLRLSKACFTFGNAVDYGAWKIERHTGIHVEVTPRLRRYPLIFGWPVLWRLYRRGALR